MPESNTRARAAAIRLQALADALLVEVRSCPPDLITWVPAEGVWSVMDILCHVQEFVPFWTSQVAQVVQHPDRTWGRDHTDANRLAAVENTAARNLAEVARSVGALVSESAVAIGRLNDAALDVEAPSVNPRWGVKPAGFIVDHLLVLHVEKHIGQIRRNVLQYQERHS